MTLIECLVKRRKILSGIGISVLFLMTGSISSRAQQPISTSTEDEGVEIVDTMTVGANEIIATATVDNEDLADIEFIGAQAFLYVGSAEVGSGPVDYEDISAMSTATSSITKGQTYTLQGWYGGCFYTAGGDDDDDDDDDDDVFVQPATIRPASTVPPPVEYACDGEWLGILPLNLQAGVPSITSISPNLGTVGDTNKKISVTGQNLQDELLVSSVSISGGVTASVSTPGQSAATVTYSIPTNATTGAQTLTMSNSFGQSNGVTFTIGDPSPTVTGISPNTWFAGSPYTVTITGTNFGTNPKVSIALPSGVIQPTPTSSSDTSVTVSFTVPANSPSGDAPVTVTSTGFNGSGFTSGGSGNSASAMDANANVEARTPAPVIKYVLDTNVAALCTGGTMAPVGENELDVSAGELVQLCAVPPAGFQITSAQWTFEDVVDISGGFTNTAGNAPPSATAGGAEANDPSLVQFNAASTDLAYFFVNPGTTETATLHWTLSNGDPIGNTSTVDFNIEGPSGIAVNAVENTVSLANSAGEIRFTMGVRGGVSGINMSVAYGSLGDTAGTMASFQWVQVITDAAEERQPGQTNSCKTQGYPAVAVDQFYPYPYPLAHPLSTNDSPGSAGLGEDQEEEYARSFSANTYLMWDPALPTGCTPARSIALPTVPTSYSTAPTQCTSSPIPLGYVTWSTSADALQTLANNAVNGWALLCSSPQAAGNVNFTASPKFPEWQFEDISVYSPNRFGNDDCQEIPQ